ncbi:MAG: hypothetical protein GX295_03325 [Syntrophomonadaceae bacterium]|nr:hypothetical protein [Syntrophomonadaceae bacterium]
MNNNSNLDLGNFIISWKRASHRVVVTGEASYMYSIFPKIKDRLINYTKKQDRVLVTNNEMFCFQGQKYNLERFIEYQEDLFYNPKNLNKHIARAKLVGSYVYLIGPDFEASKAEALLYLWRRSRILACPAIAIVPSSNDYYSKKLLSALEGGSLTRIYIEDLY